MTDTYAPVAKANSRRSFLKFIATTMLGASKFSMSKAQETAPVCERGRVQSEIAYNARHNPAPGGEALAEFLKMMDREREGIFHG